MSALVPRYPTQVIAISGQLNWMHRSSVLPFSTQAKKLANTANYLLGHGSQLIPGTYFPEWESETFNAYFNVINRAFETSNSALSFINRIHYFTIEITEVTPVTLTIAIDNGESYVASKIVTISPSYAKWHGYVLQHLAPADISSSIDIGISAADSKTFLVRTYSCTELPRYNIQQSDGRGVDISSVNPGKSIYVTTTQNGINRLFDATELINTPRRVLFAFSAFSNEFTLYGYGTNSTTTYTPVFNYLISQLLARSVYGYGTITARWLFSYSAAVGVNITVRLTCGAASTELVGAGAGIAVISQSSIAEIVLGADDLSDELPDGRRVGVDYRVEVEIKSSAASEVRLLGLTIAE